MSSTLHSIFDVVAPAKLNLFLHVVGRRADGYHLLQSLFVLIDWCDTLHFERRSDGRIARHDLGAPLPEDDLCRSAARLLQAESGTTCGVDISIDKQLPAGAGMGGGSSDAASTLLALNRLWGLNWPRARLLELGLRLGADVPFFIGGHNAVVEGIGERLSPVEVPAQWLAVIKPAESIATQAIFASPLLKRDSAAAILESFAAIAGQGAVEVTKEAPETGATGATGAMTANMPANATTGALTGSSTGALTGTLGPAWGHNDLQQAAETECVQVAEAAAVLHRQFGNSRMTGSGSAVFARAGFGSAPVAAMPSELAPGWTGRMCRSLREHPLVGWAAG